MAVSTPLLSQPNSVKSESTDPPPLEKHHPSLDSTIERCIGDFGWTQFLQALLVSSARTFDAQQTFITVFTDAHPTWHCTSHQLDCNSVSNICNLLKDSWAWDFPAYTSIISEWNLECVPSIITGLPASSFFMGCLVGGLVLATLADSSLGREKHALSLVPNYVPIIFAYCLLHQHLGLLGFKIGLWVLPCNNWNICTCVNN